MAEKVIKKASLKELDKVLYETGMFPSLCLEVINANVKTNQWLYFVDSLKKQAIHFQITKLARYNDGKINFDDTLVEFEEYKLNPMPYLAALLWFDFYKYDECPYSFMFDPSDIGDEHIVCVAGLKLTTETFNKGKFLAHIKHQIDDETLAKEYAMVLDCLDMAPLRGQNDNLLVVNDATYARGIIFKCAKEPKDREKLQAFLDGSYFEKKEDEKE